MKKHILYSEITYILGLLFLAAGVMFMEKSGFGVSMVVAPAYILYRWINPLWNSFTFGMAEYCLQALLIIIMSVIMRKFKLSFILSFVTAVIYGFILDGIMMLGAFLPAADLWQRLIYYFIGAIFGPIGVSFMFCTYISPEAYELFVKELSEYFGIEIHKFKTGYDISSCLLAILMSFAIFGFGKFIGVNWGTIVSALLNGYIISLFSKLHRRVWDIKDGLGLRKIFES